MVSGGTSEVTEGISDMRVLFLVNLGPANKHCGTGSKGAQGFQVRTIKGLGLEVQAISLSSSMLEKRLESPLQIEQAIS